MISSDSMKSQLQIRSFGGDSRKIESSARTLSISFSSDPLISWLYLPDAQPWAALNPQTQRFQERRIERASVFHLVVGIFDNTDADEDECPAVMIMHHPTAWRHSWWLQPSRWMAFLHLAVRLVFIKAEEQSCDKQRATQLFTSHDQYVSRHADLKKCWYLESVAVSPSAQGKGFGGKLMQWLVNHIGGQSCILECTDEANVPFYKKFGFETVEVVSLQDQKDPEHKVDLFVMLRKGTAA